MQKVAMVSIKSAAGSGTLARDRTAASRSADICTPKTSHTYTLWIANADHEAIDTKTLGDAVEEILFEAGKPLKTMAIVIAMRERGYRADSQLITLTRAMREYFRRANGKYNHATDGRWPET
jgi:hypothetical protein